MRGKKEREREKNRETKEKYYIKYSFRSNLLG